MGKLRESRQKGHWNGHLTLVALGLCLAFAVRVHGLDAQSFWWDEAYSTLLVEKGLRATLRELRDFDFHPPLHYVLTWAWLPLAGRGEFALRFLSVAAGTLTVAVAARLGRRLYGEGGAVVGAAAFALAPFLVYYSREARMYAPTLLLATLALYLLHRALDDSGWRLWLAYAATCALGLYTFYYFAFIPAFGGIWVLIAARERRRAVGRWLAASLLTGLLYVPWLPILLGRNAVWDSQWATTSAPLKTLGWSWAALTLGLPDLGLYAATWPTLLLGALGALLALEVPRRRRRQLRSYLFALAAFAVPLGLIAAIATLKPVFHPRYAAVAAPGLLLALAGTVAGARAEKRRWRLLSAASGLVLAAAAVFGLTSLATRPEYARDDYRSAVRHVESRLQPGDVVIYNADPGFRYYYGGAAPAGFFPGQPYEEDRIADGLNALAQGKRRLWYLRHFQVPTDPEGFVERQLDTHARRTELAWFGPLRVTLYDLPPAPEFATAAIVPTRAEFGGALLLTGYSLAAPDLPSGGQGELTLRWQVQKPLEDLGFSATVSDEQGRSWGREDRQPRNREFQLSSKWRPGEVVTTRHPVSSLVGTPPGDYALELGVYRLSDLRGLDLFDEQGRPKGQSFRLTSVRLVRAEGDQPLDPALGSRPGASLADSVELSAYQIHTAKTGPGGKVRVTILWRALAAPGQDLALDARLVEEDGSPRASLGWVPAGGRYPSSRWSDGEVVRDQVELRVPLATPPGRALLEVGLLAPGQERPTSALRLGVVEVNEVRRSFEVPTLPNRVDVDLGDQVRLLGYRLEPAAVKPGDRLRLTLFWLARVDGERSYRVFTHLLDGESKIWGQKDGEPRSWTHPTSGWARGEVVEDSYEIEVQPDAPPGAYSLEVGMYDPTTGERLRLVGAEGDRVVLQQVTIR